MNYTFQGGSGRGGEGVLSGEVNICFEKKINPQTLFFSCDINISSASMRRRLGREGESWLSRLGVRI